MLTSLALSAGGLVAGLAGGILIGKRWGVPLLSRDSEYSIALYEGPTLESLAAPEGYPNPVLRASDVTDLPARFVADPFLIHRHDGWHLFFEVIDGRNERGSIGHAFSHDARTWTYQGIVLSEPYHLSYPFVFESNGEVFMVPESSERYEVRLYRARAFPGQWELVTALLHGPFVDSTLFRYGERWWMFTGVGWGNLHLYHSSELTGPWIEHVQSPLIVSNDQCARPGGRTVMHEGALIRLAQDDYPYYGRQLRAFQIDDLSESSYVEHELSSSPLLKPGESGWNRHGMHHLDAHQLPDGRWIAAVDGFTSVLLFNRRRMLPQ